MTPPPDRLAEITARWKRSIKRKRPVMLYTTSGKKFTYVSADSDVGFLLTLVTAQQAVVEASEWVLNAPINFISKYGGEATPKECYEAINSLENSLTALRTLQGTA